MLLQKIVYSSLSIEWQLWGGAIVHNMHLNPWIDPTEMHHMMQGDMNLFLLFDARCLLCFNYYWDVVVIMQGT